MDVHEQCFLPWNIPLPSKYFEYEIYKLQMESNDEVISIIWTELHLSQGKIVGTNDIPTIV